MEALQSRQQARELRATRKALKDLTHAVGLACARLDAAMQMPESRQRGEVIGTIVTLLDMANDLALHFALKRSFLTMAKDKRRLAAAVAAQGLPQREEHPWLA